MIAFPGDFYNEGGKKIGTDGKDDGKVYVVTDKKEVNQIKKTDKEGGTTQKSEVSLLYSPFLDHLMLFISLFYAAFWYISIGLTLPIP